MSTPTRPLPPHGTEGRYKGSQTRPPCHCPRCTRASYLANIRRARIRAEHGGNRISRDILLPHVDALLAAGMSRGAIARAAGVSVSTISYIKRGLSNGCQRDQALRILAVQPGQGVLRPDATGTIRRIRALYAIGHGQQAIADAAGIERYYVSRLIADAPLRVSSRLAGQIARAYRILSRTPGTSKRAIARARREGWHSPAAWDGDAIDDPCALPERDTGHDALTQAEARAINGEEMRHLASLGVAEHDIARRLGLGERHVHDTLRNLREAA
ncbi:hypothetical protein MTQ13_03295 [Streptomyces sp. XM4011]|uniref:hypothetical protein n=1 Tax=Streptomyces sp. XM4011 TaxID=2929780 RepID=UPI001FFA5619|nr:hypothetical protein [Streptomyces sp. XM4011]MCK1813307.1 hypothetical protein [Streptomyces sp. XM4011]